MVLMLPFLTNAITISSMARLTFAYPSHQNMSVKYGITVKQMFKILKNLLKTLKNLLKTLGSLSIYSKVDLLKETLLNIFQNYIPNKKINCDYRQPPWMTNNIKRSSTESSKLTKCYYKNSQKKKDYEKLLESLLIVLKKFWKLKIITFLK